MKNYSQLKNTQNEPIIKLTHQRLIEMLDYNQNTGVFVRKVSIKSSSYKAGDVAGGFDEKGYVRIRIDQCKYKGHRLAWFYVHKEWPKGQIDHIDGNKGNNAIANLRVSDTALNKQNSKKANKNCRSGLLGVHWCNRSKKWLAHISCAKQNIRSKYLGSFLNPDDAHDAYLKAKRLLHDFCTI